MNNAIAQTILQQLGGNKFLAMTAARMLVATQSGLQFKLPRNESGVVCIVIDLDPSDTYTVNAYDTKGLKSCTPSKVVSGVYADRLQAVFTELTGLDTHL